MKTKSKLVLFLLALMLIATSCGNQNESVNTDGTKDVSSDTVKIGALAPLTGNVAIYGKMSSNGSKLAVEEINASGGINGMQVELLLEDEKGDPTEAVNAYNKLLGEGIHVLLGDVTSAPTEAVAALANEDKMPLITPTGTQDTITKDREYAFRVCYTDSYQGTILAQYAAENLGAKKVALMTNNSSDYSDGVTNSFKENAIELGIEIVAEEAYGNNDADFKAQLTNIASVKPDVILVSDYYETIAMIAPQAVEIGIDAKFIGPDGWDGVLAQLGETDFSSVEGAVFTNHYSLDDPREQVQNFLKAYEEKYNEVPASFAALGYDGVYLIKQAIEEAGSLDPELIKDAMKAIDFQGVTGHLNFDESNNPIKEVSMIMINNGEYKLETTVMPK